MDGEPYHTVLESQDYLERLLWAIEEIAARHRRRSMFSGFGADLSDDCSSGLLNNLALQEPCTSTGDFAKVMLLLKEKERNLELTARIGASLVEQNKELQERNEFLEESLTSSNDAIAHLRRELRQRNRLYCELAHLSEEEDASGREDDVQPSTSRQLQENVKALENENSRLKAETARLQNLSEQAEKQESSRVRECMGQLDQACSKISRLQAELTEKGQQCEQQTKEIKRLMHEVAEQRDREETLLESNVDLNIQLSDAVENHENLRFDMTKLQDRYLEVMSMLQETEDELRVYRQRVSAVYRANSIDSLYDSLASELEASDSGCYNTPQFSARCDSQQSPVDRDPMSQQIERLRQQSNYSPIMEADVKPVGSETFELSKNVLAICDPDDPTIGETPVIGESFDIPSKALVNAVRTCSFIRVDESKRPVGRNRSALALRSNSAAHSVCNEPLDGGESDQLPNALSVKPFECAPILALRTVSGSEPLTEDDIKGNTPMMDAMSFSTMSCQSVNTVVPALIMVASGLSLNSVGTSRSLKADARQSSSLKNVSRPEPTGLVDRRASVSSWTALAADSYERNGKWLRSTSCSPIELGEHEDIGMTSTVEMITEGGEFESHLEIVQPITSCHLSTKPSEDASNSTLKELKAKESSTLNKSSSSESLSSNNTDYETPRLGEPGRLGTRDLDQSLRRLKLKRKLELNYEAFRRRRGLAPSRFAFYSGVLDMTWKPCSSLAASPNRRRMYGVLSSQMEAMTSRHCDDCRAANPLLLAPLSRAHEWMRSFRHIVSKVSALPPMIQQPVTDIGGRCSTIKFRGAKSRTINDISLAILATPVEDETTNSTIVLRTQEFTVRRRASSLSRVIKIDATDSSLADENSFQRNHLRCSLRASSKSSCLKARSTAVAQLTTGKSIAGWLGGRTWIPPPSGGMRLGLCDDSDETGLNFLSADPTV